MMLKKIMLFGIAIHYSFISAVGWSNNPQYKNAALNTIHEKLQRKAINISTDEAVNNDVVQRFEDEFLTDADEDALPGEKRQTQRIMTLIRAAYKSQTVSGLTFEVNDLFERESLDFHNKEEALQAEKDGLWGKKIMWGIATGIGLCAVICATQMGGGRDKAMALVVGGGGGLATIGGGAKLYYTIGKEEKLKIHIEKHRIMKNSWENSFKVK